MRFPCQRVNRKVVEPGGYGLGEFLLTENRKNQREDVSELNFDVKGASPSALRKSSSLVAASIRTAHSCG